MHIYGACNDMSVATDNQEDLYIWKGRKAMEDQQDREKKQINMANNTQKEPCGGAIRELRCAEQLAFLRREKQVTQEQLAQAMGVTNQAVSKWESGDSHS